ncbi:MAG TPA: hypothetical protein DCM50_09210 [Stenotrophomonas sp.]|nr:hypothetical protein [Stenotrophomonas sp.]
MTARTAARLLLAIATVLPLAAAQADPVDALALARQVNEQIVHKHMREEVQAFAQAFNGSTMLPQDVPTGCRAQMQTAVTGMYAAMVGHMQAGVDDPAYQRAIEAKLAAAYSTAELQAFLADLGSTEVATLATRVMAAPGLKQAQQAQQQKILDGVDENATGSPELAAALRATNAAQAACQALQTDAG